MAGDSTTNILQAGSKEFVHSGNVLFESIENIDARTEYRIKVKSSYCADKCNKKCEDIILSLSEKESSCLKRSFEGHTVVETKNNLLKHLISQSRLGVSEQGYFLKGHLFCTKSFSNYTKISEYILKKVLNDFQHGALQYVHGNDSNPRESVASVKFTSWMLVFSELYGQSAPDELTTVLPSWLSKATLFKIYLEESTAPFVKKSSFYQLFEAKFGYMRNDKSLPHIRISKYSTHSVCSTCVALQAYQRSCKTEQELQYSKGLMSRHKQCIGQTRRKICELQQLAITYPADHLFLSFDGMDNRKSDIPKFQENAKSFSQFQTLPSHIHGAIVTSGWYPEKRKCYFFVNHNQGCIFFYFKTF